ncbi:hypothetical protein JB92DRAFT_2699094, partial [Gautieria morchelliformis]
TSIPPNMKSALDQPSIIDEHLQEEIEADCMSGPFTIDEAHTIFDGHFCTSPLGLIEKEPGSGKWRLICNTSCRDSHNISMNNMLNSDDFPTRWGLAWLVVQYVSKTSSPSTPGHEHNPAHHAHTHASTIHTSRHHHTRHTCTTSPTLSTSNTHPGPTSPHLPTPFTSLMPICHTSC